tara:strand:+ start:166 stop:396 length:231 start_codon:yes stop_codon:yes gene_type:complete
MRKPRQFELPDDQYLISESDIMDILIAYNNQDYEWILYFFESLVPVQSLKKHIKIEPTYTFNEVLKMAGIKLQGKR